MGNKLHSVSIYLLLSFNFLLAGSNDKSIKAIPTTETIIIDGVSRESSWSNALPAKDFTQRDPFEGEPESEKTEVRVLYDNQALYIFFNMLDSDPSKIIQRLSRRDDNDVESDNVTLSIDSYHDHQTGVTFSVNAAGTKSDGLMSDDGKTRDFSWNAVWDVATQVNSNGWTAEFRIPFSVIRFKPSDEEITWGINFTRKITRKQEFSTWAFWRKSESGWISRYAHLTGLKNISSPKALEVSPYLIGTGKYFPTQEGKNKVAGLFPNVGVDAKYGISGNTILNLTVNPDFGQVEADPSELNLSTFETFYEERRPFFIEGSDIFNFSTFGSGFGPGLFYSRRIGQSINVSPPEGSTIVEEPLNATILGAAKLTGQTQDGLSFGLLSAVTDKEYFTFSNSSGINKDSLARPGMNYGVFRAKQNIWSGSSVGMILTSRTSADLLPVTVGGVDWRLRFSENKYSVSGFFASSASDSKHPSTFKEVTNNAGSGRLSFSKEGGENWLFDLTTYFTGRDYNVNDLGYFRRADDFGSYNSVTYKDDKPGDVFRFYRLTVPFHVMYNLNGDLLEKNTGLRLFSKLVNYYELSGQINYNFSSFDDRESRGYGLYKKPSGINLDLVLGSDESKDFRFVVGGGFGNNEFGGNGFGLVIGFDFRPSSSSNIGVSLKNGARFKEEAFVVVENEISIFGDRTVRENNLTIRSSFLFNPDLSLQLYTQYFAVRGMYENYGSLINTKVVPSSYSESNSFNETALNLNFVLRWEYLPGSVLYAVWAHNRNWGNGIYQTSYMDQFNNTFKVAPNNVFTLKVSYWFNV